MSLRGQIGREAKGLFDVIQDVSLKGKKTHRGDIVGTSKTMGYVSLVHDGNDPNEEFRWTVDVAEYNYNPDFPDEGLYHEGVKITAIQNNVNGIMIVPTLFSDVVITLDPSTNDEYVIMFSQVDLIQLRSHKEVKLGVVETEDVVEGDDTPDYDELEETGNAATTNYSATIKEDEVKTSDSYSKVKQTASSYEVDINDQGGFVIGSDGIPHINGNSYQLVRFDKLESLLNSFINALDTAVIITPSGNGSITPGTFSGVSSMISGLKSEALKVGK